MRFQILGPVQVFDSADQPITIRRGKARMLLTALLLHSGQIISHERLMRVLWEDEPPASAIGNIRTYACLLRSGINDHLVSYGSGYALSAPDATIDYLVWTDLVNRGAEALERGAVQEALTPLSIAEDLWLGDMAHGIPRFGPLAGWLAAVEERRLRAADDLAEARMLSGAYQPAISTLRAVLAEHPARERSWGLLMTALESSGNVDAALRCFSEATSAMRNELGMDPAPGLNHIFQRILQRT